MTLQVYETLYSSSLDFGIRKCLEAEKDLINLEKTVEELEEKKERLEFNVLQKKMALNKLEENLEKESEKKKERHAYVIEFLNKEKASLAEYVDASKRNHE